MASRGIISRTDSPWASPILMVKKKTGDWRFAVDYRKLNQHVALPGHSLPNIQDILARLGGSTIFSALDAAAGFWQVSMAEESKPLTAFVTPNCGTWAFEVMPFGVSVAPGIYQRLMEKVLDGLPFAYCYIDDILVASRDIDSHVKHLTIVFERLKAANLKLKLQKCQFGLEKLTYLGHTLSANGLEPDTKKVQALLEYKKRIPSNVQEVRRLLGAVVYYKRFIPRFSDIASCLINLTRANVTFYWTSECQHAFETLIDKLVTAPVLALPDFTKPFIIESDASAVAIG